MLYNISSTAAKYLLIVMITSLVNLSQHNYWYALNLSQYIGICILEYFNGVLYLIKCMGFHYPKFSVI